ncbi:MAG: type I-A CRISPR-associated protein Cas7/Csa2 [Archaeoglobaceae archaeon]
MFVSIRGRVLLNVEALNMTESVGNYVKHRRVPVILPSNGYTTLFVPAISGESIAHGFQALLAEVAKKNNLPVCKLCEKGIFLKSTNNSVFSNAFNEEAPSDDFELEKRVLSKCVVEDIGGFLYAEKMNVKRTSNFFTGYMIPVKETLENVVIEPQLHSRYALGTPFVQQQGQMIYYVELSSAIYTFSFDFDAKFVGKTTFSYQNAGKEVVTDRKQRIEATLEAIKKFLVEFSFGAKKTRFMPVVEWESLAIAVSDDTWTVPSPFSKNYIENAKKKLDKVNYNTKLFVYPEQGNFEEVISLAMDEAKRRV